MRSGRGNSLWYRIWQQVVLLPSLAVAAQPADFVFRHGAVYTVENEQPWAESVAVKADRIIFVGAETGLAHFIGPRTKVIDLAGGMMLPGFIDSHAHISAAEKVADAALTFRGQPPEVVISALKRYVEAHPDDRMVLGSGWIYEAFPTAGPTREMIDSFIPDRPAVLTAIDGHNMWVNSRALEIAGITRLTPDPLPGKSWFQRNAQGEPTGFVVEHAAMDMLRDGLAARGYPIDTRERLSKGIEQGVPMLAAAGITTMFDAAMRDPDTTFAILHQMEQRGALSVRIYGSYVYAASGKDPIEGFRALQQQYHSEKLGLEMIKLFLDGTETNYTAYMLEPFADRPESRGAPLIAPEVLNDLVQRIDAAGIDVHMHVVGDAAAREGLDAIEYAIEHNAPRDRRDALAHCILVDPADIPRFRKLGVIWQTTPSWAVMNSRNLTVRRLVGQRRFSAIYPLQAVIDQGVLLASGSDLTGLSAGDIYKPLDQMEIGHNRQPIDGMDDEIMPEPSQRVNLPDLIRSYTINGAYMLRREHKLGSIKAGKQADLVILNKNLFEVARHDIHKVQVVLTMMDGKVTYVASR
jgi:predicted amidohydrolase YtcJ